MMVLTNKMKRKTNTQRNHLHNFSKVHQTRINQFKRK